MFLIACHKPNNIEIRRLGPKRCGLNHCGPDFISSGLNHGGPDFISSGLNHGGPDFISKL